VLVLFAFATLWRLSTQAELIPGVSSRTAAMISVVRETQWGPRLAHRRDRRSRLGGWTGNREAIADRMVHRGCGARSICVGEALTGHAGAMPRAPLRDRRRSRSCGWRKRMARRLAAVLALRSTGDSPD
jgi:hypothetical protein